MKKSFLCTLYMVLCSLLVSSSLYAVDYCATSSWGYAGSSVTGGGSATPTLVKNESQLKDALNSNNKVIIITQDITVTNHISSDKSNLTIMALPGVKLISNQQNQDKSGILYLKGSNLLLRNLTFVGPGAYDCDGWDNLCLDKATHVWVDHCDFQDGCDGNFDIKSLSDNITVTWCRFRYLKAPTAGGSGGADDHRFSNLIGSSSSDKPTDGTYNITYGFCWWDEGCKQRMTRCRNAELHFLNCYWNSSVADYYVGPENVSAYFEGCTFAGKANSASKIWSQYSGSTNYCRFVNCSGNLPSNSGSVAAPAYAYDQLSASQALNYVTNSSCGAGATLTVTSAANVSSSCDGGDKPSEGTISDWWNFSDSDFSELAGDITTTTTVRDLHIVAAEGKQVTIDASAQTYGEYAFTHRLKFNGSGSSTARHLWFDVTGNCTITVFLMSANLNAERTLNIATGSFDAVAKTMTAGATLSQETFTYTGGATRMYLYSANSGINLYGIQVAYPDPSTGLIQTDAVAPAVKIIRDKQVYILRDGKMYTIYGTRVR